MDRVRRRKESGPDPVVNDFSQDRKMSRAPQDCHTERTTKTQSPHSSSFRALLLLKKEEENNYYLSNIKIILHLATA